MQNKDYKIGYINALTIEVMGSVLQITDNLDKKDSKTKQKKAISHLTLSNKLVAPNFRNNNNIVEIRKA